METKQELEYCPICYKLLSTLEIEDHVNKCIFLNSTNHQGKPKRKRSPSPTPFTSKQKCFERLATSKNNSKAATSNYNGVSKQTDVPLATLMQPKSIKDFYGQNHILDKNKYLRSMLDNNEIPSIILWGPPGCGKTSLAKIISEICKRNPLQYRYIEICAVDCGIKEVQNIIKVAETEIKSACRVVVFIDEIQWLNKRLQNKLSVQIVKGNLILVGATTENPSFRMSDIFLNICKVIVMEKLDSCHLMYILERTLTALNITIIDDNNTICNYFRNNQNSICIQHSAVKWLAETTDGDARIALNNLQLVLQHNNNMRNKLLTIANIKDGIKKSHLLYDRDGEEHHNIISAMHESIKGYNDNATLYWIARMLVGGEDPLFIARRLVRAASEDTGNADPKALQLAVSTMHGCQELEVPETHILLAQCAIYLARAPTTKQMKSALGFAKQIINESKGQQPAVPVHLRNLPIKLMKELGYKESSKENAQSFMPDGLENVKFL